MKTFTLELHDASHMHRVDGVVSFVAEDASGSFGLMAGHARFMTSLGFGLARFRRRQGGWHYIAMPGAVLYFAADRLWIGTRRFVLDDDYNRISRLLREQLLTEEQALRNTKRSLRRMEEELLRRLWQLGTGVQ
jgi:F-type H+-transporting ATPase subunit epsilon